VFDARYFAFATVSGLLVLSPGATMAVVLQMAVERGRRAALVTVVGVNFGNSTLALASAVGMAALFARWPWSLEVVKVGGAAYLAYLGVRGLWMAWRERPIPAGGPVATAAALSAAPAWTAGATGEALRRGIVTNLLNPSVVVFYMTLLPQFIGPRDPFLPRFLVLAATHVTMSLTWLTTYAVLMGTFAERLSRPGVRRALESLTGLVLLGFGVRLIVR
jgi:threonine/homoserine/homoserine lactone efflux protein